MQVGALNNCCNQRYSMEM